MRWHTGFCTVPTAPGHVGQWLVAYLNRQLAVYMGGTFVYRFYCTLAIQKDAKLRSGRPGYDPVRDIVEGFMAEVSALGLPPTPPAGLAAQGFSPSLGVTARGSSEVTLWYWRLFGLDRVFGNWPPPYPEGPFGNNEAYLLPFAGAGVASARPEHPYIVLERVVEDLLAGRNLRFRGADLQHDADLYYTFSSMILEKWPGAVAPRVYYVPRLREVGSVPASEGISAGSLPAESPLRLSAALRSGRTVEEIEDFLLGCYFAEREPEWIDPELVISRIKPNPVIDLAEWVEFLGAGRSAAPWEQEARAKSIAFLVEAGGRTSGGTEWVPTEFSSGEPTFGIDAKESEDEVLGQDHDGAGEHCQARSDPLAYDFPADAGEPPSEGVAE